MLVDANILIYAVDERSPFHDRARRWLEDALNGDRRVGLPWPSLNAFVRLTTNSRAATKPLAPDEAWAFVAEWLDVRVVWIPLPTTRHAALLGGLIHRYQLRGNLIPDAHLAALAMQHGLTIESADTDFARFDDVRWHNPLA